MDRPRRARARGDGHDRGALAGVPDRVVGGAGHPVVGLAVALGAPATRTATLPGDDQRVRRRLDVPGAVPLRTVDLAVGAAPELLAGDRDRGAAQVDDVVALGWRPATSAAAYPSRASGPVERDTITSNRAVAGVGLRGQLGAAADEGPLPTATIRIGWSRSTTTSPSTSTRTRMNGGFTAVRSGADRVAELAEVDLADPDRRAAAPSTARRGGWPGRRRRRARC